MATAPSLRNKLEEELECSLCLERLNDPRVFPQCQHSFCYGCIVKLSQGKSKIFCPECRAEVELGIPPDLSHFKRNTRINNILEYMNDNLPDSTKPEVDQNTQNKTNEAPERNEGTDTNHRDAEKSGAGVGTSADNEQQKPNNASKDNPPSVPPTSTDIAEMKSKVSKQFQDTVIRSQEHILKKTKQKLTPKKRYFEEHGASNTTKNDKSMSFEDQKDDAHIYSFYILLRERMAKKLEKNYSPMSSSIKFLSLLKGEILIRNVTTAANESNGLIRLHSYAKPAYFSDCPLADVKGIDEEEAKLLLPISTMGDRFKLFDNKSLLENGKKITVGSSVYVTVRSVGGGASKHELRGIVRYKGPLPKEYGTWFGVELLEGEGSGTTNGMYKGVRFFKCQTDFGVFVSLEKLRLCEDQTETESKTDTKEVNGTDESNSGVFTKVKKFAESLSSFVLEEQSYENSLDMQRSAGHQMDDRVWVYVGDELCAGFIRYIGKIPGIIELLVGIELDKNVGQGNGEHYNRQLFECPMNHAYFTPITNVISQEKHQELYGQPEDATVLSGSPLRNNPPTVPQILNMESKFSSRSKDQVIKEQEMILQKIKQDQEQKMAKKY